MTKPANSNLIECATREEWLRVRRSGIGGSESAIILGTSKYKSPYALWAEKAGIIDLSTEETEIQKFGHLMEPVVAQQYEEATGRKVTCLGKYTIRRHSRLPFMTCTHDYIVEAPEYDRPGPLSIKTAAWFKKDEWKDAQAPLDYEIQLQHEIAVMGDTDWGSFAVLIWGHGVKWFDRKANVPFIETMERACTGFWNRVQTGDAPPLIGHSDELEAVRAFYPQAVPGKVIQLGEQELEWTLELAGLRSERLAIEGKEEHLKALITQAIGDADEAELPDGRRWTNKPNKNGRRTLQPPKEKKEDKAA